MAASGAIWELMAKSEKTNKTILQERLRRRNSAGAPLIQEFQGQSFVRFMRSARNAAVLFKSVVKDPDATKQISDDTLTSTGSQPRKADFTCCPRIFRLRGESFTSKDALKGVIAGKDVFCTRQCASN
jgi:hypothetical protein